MLYVLIRALSSFISLEGVQEIIHLIVKQDTSICNNPCTNKSRKHKDKPRFPVLTIELAKTTKSST